MNSTQKLILTALLAGASFLGLATLVILEVLGYLSPLHKQTALYGALGACLISFVYLWICLTKYIEDLHLEISNGQKTSRGLANFFHHTLATATGPEPGGEDFAHKAISHIIDQLLSYRADGYHEVAEQFFHTLSDDRVRGALIAECKRRQQEWTKQYAAYVNTQSASDQLPDYQSLQNYRDRISDLEYLIERLRKSR